MPPNRDPRRPLQLAIRSMVVLGSLFAILGLIVLASMSISGSRPGFGTYDFFYLSIVVFFYVGQGVAYFLFAYHLKRRRRWVIIAGLILAGVQMIFGIIVLVQSAIAFQDQPWAIQKIQLIVLAVLAMIILALLQLICHLVNSFEAVKHVPIDEERGFEPLMIQPQEPPIEDDM